MKPGAVIVNTSRGGIIDEAALADALKAGTIGGAGIDVFEAEPPPADHPLFALDNVVLGPHVAGVTEASMKHMALHCAQVVETILSGERPATLLNPEAVQ
jgi:phosphoglycerate dehydrogenase-like enzyme